MLALPNSISGLLALLLALLPQTGGQTAPCEARLQVEHDQDLLTITGYCRSRATQPASYRYELRVEKRGPGGQSTNQQSGQFELGPEQTVRLSQVALNVGGDYSGRLRILTQEGLVVAQDSVRPAAQH